MNVRKAAFAALALIILIAPLAGSKPGKAVSVVEKGTAVLWHNPVEDRGDLFYGPGSKERAPRGPFVFIKEDTGGSSPKYDVRDGEGHKWKIKLGAEARSETTASRLIWAAGYFANEDYFVDELRVDGLPANLKRHKRIEAGGVMRQARMKREPENQEKVGVWKWRDNPFRDTREWNGLRTLMAVLNNWDVKDVNNGVYRTKGELIYMVSDVGASFGAPGRSWPASRSKDNFEMYRRSRFVCGETPDLVDFCAPSRPSIAHMVDPLEYSRRMKLRWIGDDIPRADARWLGGLLSRLSQQQIREAFRAGGYSQDEIEGFSRVVSQRIGELNEL